MTKEGRRLNEAIFEGLRFGDDGLLPVVAQDAVTGEILMLAWADREALRTTEELGELVLYSRSRKELWHKGKTSGNRMKVLALRADCDSDAVVALVDPAGPACHTGARSCFFRNLLGEGGDEASFPGRLWRYLLERRHDGPDESYTASLLARGKSRVGQKIGEEGVETAIAVATGDREGTLYEAADLVYHLLVGLIALDIPLGDLWKELASRHRPREGKNERPSPE
jgi:phosphoribosyl-ATP pyrophosphohydrolase/phosphoribosyl-AMP cyclohydrolase